jgi:HSP20 family protein
MEVLRWDPFSDLEVLQDRINRAFEESRRQPQRREQAATRTWAPVVDILEDEGELNVKADLPGVKLEEINIEFTGDTLTIRGNRTPETEVEKENYLRVERPIGQFARSFTVGIPINVDAIKASYRDGVLEVHLPKAEEVKPKRVEIQTG